MHDAVESITGDVPTPVKNSLNLIGNGVWRNFEFAITKRMSHYWGYTFPFPHTVHEADRTALRIEVASLASNEMKTSLRKLGVEPLYDARWMIQEVWTADRAYAEFMRRFDAYGPTGRRK
jgi:5'-deoxynucleotidase YfbR-like HD superfamily hydrolase